MNTNIILDGFNAMLKQLIASAVADAVKPLQDRIVAVEINQSMGKAVFTLPDVDFNEAVRNVLDGYNFINRNDVVDLVDKVVENAIEAYDFSDSFDFENALGNHDFREIVEESMPDDMVNEDRVQEMIDEALDSCTIRRG